MPSSAGLEKSGHKTSAASNEDFMPRKLIQLGRDRDRKLPLRCCIVAQADCQSATQSRRGGTSLRYAKTGMKAPRIVCSADSLSAVSQAGSLRLSKRQSGVANLPAICYAKAVNPQESNHGLNRVKFQLRSQGVPEIPPNRLYSGIHSRGYLPHVKKEGGSYFVTFRLADSLPKEVLVRFEREHAENLRRLSATATAAQFEEIHRNLRRKVERYLDQGVGDCHLRRPEIAHVVSEALLHFHGEQYLLDDWVVMPNHVHLILWPMPNHTLSDILKGRKRHTARQANLLLGRTGEIFWQRESFDHWIRNDDEKARIRRYIRMNPVNARLCKSPEEWKWGSAWPEWKM